MLSGSLTFPVLDGPSITDQMMSRLKIQIRTHPFTCASYHPFEVIHLDRISLLRPDTHGNMIILVLIGAFSVGRAIPHRGNDGFRVGVMYIPTYGTIRHTRSSSHRQ